MDDERVDLRGVMANNVASPPSSLSLAFSNSPWSSSCWLQDSKNWLWACPFSTASLATLATFLMRCPRSCCSCERLQESLTKVTVDVAESLAEPLSHGTVDVVVGHFGDFCLTWSLLYLECATTYDNVRQRTTTYDNVRQRTTTYDNVRQRMTTYDNIRQRTTMSAKLYCLSSCL